MEELTGQKPENLRMSRQHLSPLESDIIGSTEVVRIESDTGGKQYVVGSSNTSAGLSELLQEHFDEAITPLLVRNGMPSRLADEKRKALEKDDGIVVFFKPEIMAGFILKGVMPYLLYSELDEKGRMKNVSIKFMKGDQSYMLTEEDKNKLGEIADVYQQALELGNSDNDSVAIYNFKKNEQ